ncbi:hypothetical protein AB0H71_14350 [Nocardia sp. NPDC050697]|uniref:hypothetical protein n=1 Tax=Nocardia sp. NPDC050697 TaxID=3155158 RepID=UPI0033E8732E
MAQGLVDDGVPPPPLPDLVRGARRTLELRAECDDTQLAGVLPGLISGLYTYTRSASDEERRQAWEALGVGRAYGMEKNYERALYVLLRAEYIAPEKVRSMTSVREQVGSMMRRARRELTTGDLGQLAQRVGAIPA